MWHVLGADRKVLALNRIEQASCASAWWRVWVIVQDWTARAGVRYTLQLQALLELLIGLRCRSHRRRARGSPDPRAARCASAPQGPDGEAWSYLERIDPKDPKA